MVQESFFEFWIWIWAWIQNLFYTKDQADWFKRTNIFSTKAQVPKWNFNTGKQHCCQFLRNGICTGDFFARFSPKKNVVLWSFQVVCSVDLQSACKRNFLFPKQFARLANHFFCCQTFYQRLIISKKIPVQGIFPRAGEIGFFGLKSLCYRGLCHYKFTKDSVPAFF